MNNYGIVLCFLVCCSYRKQTSLQQWLEEVQLPDLYKLLCDAGIEDLEAVSRVSTDELERAGINKNTISRLLTASNMLKLGKHIAVY